MRRAALFLLLVSLAVPARSAAPVRARRPPPAEAADDAADKDADAEDDGEEAAASKPRPGKGKPVARPPEDDDSEDEDEDEPAPVARPAKRPATRKPAPRVEATRRLTLTPPVGALAVAMSNARPAQGSVLLVRCTLPGAAPAGTGGARAEASASGSTGSPDGGAAARAAGGSREDSPAGSSGPAPTGSSAGLPDAAAAVSITATFAGRTFTFYPSAAPGTQVGLIGVDLELAPGSYELVITAATTPPVVQRVPVAVAAGDFSVQRLKVPPKMVNPDPEAEKRIAREQAITEKIHKQVTPKVFTGSFIRPVPGAPTASFGGRRIFNGVAKSPHSGLDLRGATGTPIKAPAPGRVVLVADHYFTGNTVILDHGLGIFTQYAHMSAFSVTEGQVVKPGDLLGKVGETGRVTGPHLHWGAKLSGAKVNPLDLIKLPL